MQVHKKLKKIGLNKTIGDFLFNLFSGGKKASWDKIEKRNLFSSIGSNKSAVPGALIKCTVDLKKGEFKKETTLDGETSTTNTNGTPYIPSTDIYTDDLWSTASKSGSNYIFNNIRITKSYLQNPSNELIACKFLGDSSSEFVK